MGNKALGSLLLINLILNTKNLSSIQTLSEEPRGEETMFHGLYPQDLYPRLVSDIDFSKLSEEEKSKFLFLHPAKEGQVDKQELHDYEMMFFATESHNRTCASLGVPKTNIILCDFTKNPSMDPNNWVLYDGANDNIYVNIDKDYTISRPSFLLENLNGATRHHSIYQNILTAAKDPNALSDRDFFLALTTALKVFVYQDLKQNDPVAYTTLIAADYSTPSNIEEVVYAFDKTRSDFQQAGLYGGKLQEDLRRNETIYHEYLQNELLTNSLINLEDIIEYFNNSELNQSSDGLLGKMLDHMLRETAASFYNSLGAEMQPGQSITDYVDKLEREMFDEYGMEMPTDEQLERYIKTGSTEGPDDEEDEEYYTALREYEEEQAAFGMSDESAEAFDDEEPKYPPMKSALPNEGVIQQIDKLPFHTYESQDPTQN